MHMYKHFENMMSLYGDAYVQIPNSLFSVLSKNIKAKNKSNIQQISFAYTYMVVIAFLYKYAHYVDIDNETYIQNGDIKQILGYGKTTKTIDKIIKKDGILESLGLIRTTKEYPIDVEYSTSEKINGIYMRDFILINSLDRNGKHYNIIKDIVKNRNYEIKEPTFLFEYEGDIGTLYNYQNTHRITIDEFMKIIYSQEFDNVDFLMYAFFKYKCLGFKDNMKSMAIYKITSEMGIGSDTFYTHLEKLKNNHLINVSHKGWRVAGEKHNAEIEANEYYFKGIS